MKTCTCGVNISEHPASRCLDALVAVTFFEYTRYIQTGFVAEHHHIRNKENEIVYTPHYSSDIAAAMELADEMSAKNYWYYLGNLSSVCYAIFEDVKTRTQYRGEAKVYDLPLAITRAACLTAEE